MGDTAIKLKTKNETILFFEKVEFFEEIMGRKITAEAIYAILMVLFPFKFKKD